MKFSRGTKQINTIVPRRLTFGLCITQRIKERKQKNNLFFLNLRGGGVIYVDCNLQRLTMTAKPKSPCVSADTHRREKIIRCGLFSGRQPSLFPYSLQYSLLQRFLSMKQISEVENHRSRRNRIISVPESPE